MNKFSILVLTTLVSSGVWAENVPYRAITQCQYDYDDFNFCSKANITKYKNALKTQNANFNQKYILLNLSSLPKTFRFVVLDTKNGLVLPLRDSIIGFKDDKGGLTGKPPAIQYSVNSPNLCMKGSISAYRDAYDNVKTCYSIQDDEYSEYGKEFTRVDTPTPLN